MDPLTTAAAGGMRARLESLDMLANNIANASTTGYKVDREFYSVYADAEARTGADGAVDSVLPLVEKPWTDFAQGTLAPTGRPLDLALSGKGFFGVTGPSGPLYTRAGNFEVTSAGTVVTQEGHPIRLVNGSPLKVIANQPFEVSENGTVSQSGAVLGRLDLVDLPDDGVVKQGATLFRMLDQKVKPAPARDVEVHQGKLEGSNVSTPETAVRLISLMRQFETLQKAVGVGADMNRRALEEVARVGS